MAENGVIGRAGQLPWHLADDLKRFKRLTMGRTIIMGRKTWESIGRPLSGRRMVVVSRQPDYRITVEDRQPTHLPGSPARGVHLAQSLDDALRLATSAAENEAFIIGGAEIYRQALPRTDRLYITRVLGNVEGDTYFPEVNWNEWRIVESDEHDADSKNDYPQRFEVYERDASSGVK